jgi:hypothetical protein
MLAALPNALMATVTEVIFNLIAHVMVEIVRKRLQNKLKIMLSFLLYYV